MNFYPFYIGDYAQNTKHLDPMEDLAYRRLLELYYMRESALPSDILITSRLIRMLEHYEMVKAILEEFFTLTESGWNNSRCDYEISKIHNIATSCKPRNRSKGLKLLENWQ